MILKNIKIKKIAWHGHCGPHRGKDERQSSSAQVGPPPAATSASRDPSPRAQSAHERPPPPARGTRSVRSHLSSSRTSPRPRSWVVWRRGVCHLDRSASAWDSFFLKSAPPRFQASWPARDSTTPPHLPRPPESSTDPTRGRRPGPLPRGSDPRIEPAPRENPQRRRGGKLFFCWFVSFLCSRIGRFIWIRRCFPLKDGSIILLFLLIEALVSLDLLPAIFELVSFLVIKLKVFG